MATFLGGTAADSLRQEIAHIAADIGPITVSLRMFTLEGLHDYLLRTQPHDGTESLDLVVVPNDWLGQLAERSLIGDIPSSRIEPLQRRLIRQALVAVSDHGQVLAYPLSAEVLALVYNPDYFPAPPRSIEEVIGATLPGNVIPLAINVSTLYHLTPFLSCFQKDMLDIRGAYRVEPEAWVAVFRHLEPLWLHDNAWFVSRQRTIESLNLQFFSRGRLASFLTGPWMLDSLESLDCPFAVIPPPPFSDAPYPSRPPVGYISIAVSRQSRWADLSHEIAGRLLDRDSNDRFNQRARRLPVLLECYKTERAVASAATLGFLRALENGEALPASSNANANVTLGIQQLQAISSRPQPPTAEEVAALLTGNT